MSYASNQARGEPTTIKVQNPAALKTKLKNWLRRNKKHEHAGAVKRGVMKAARGALIINPKPRPFLRVDDQMRRDIAKIIAEEVSRG